MPPEVAHGFITLSQGTAVGSVATYSCERQYVLDGISTRECEMNNEWSGQPPTCRRELYIELVCCVDTDICLLIITGLCDTLRSPANGQVSVPNLPVEGVTASFSCDTGYELIGADTSMCLSSGQWSAQDPTCQCKIRTSPPQLILIACSVCSSDPVPGAAQACQWHGDYQLSGQEGRLHSHLPVQLWVPTDGAGETGVSGE